MSRSDIVMLCDVDLGEFDATRVHTVEVAQGFVTAGHAVRLMTRGPDPQLPGVTHLRAAGADTQRIRRVVSLQLLALWLVLRSARQTRLLYVRHRWTMTPALVFGRLLGYQVVTQVDDLPFGKGHGVPINPVVDHVSRWCTRVMTRLARGIVAVTPQLGDLLVEQFGGRREQILVLPNGVDIAAFRSQPREPARLRLGIAPEVPLAIFVGNFASWVDFDTMLRGFAVARREVADARLVLIGDGGARGHVEQLLDELSLRDAVELTGLIAERERVRDYVAAATVTLAAHRPAYTARIGLSPVKIAEYLASGRAVVAIDVPGIREVVGETGAGIVTPIDPDAYGQALARLLDPARADAYGRRGRQIAEARFSWTEISRATLELFDDPAAEG